MDEPRLEMKLITLFGSSAHRNRVTYLSRIVCHAILASRARWTMSTTTTTMSSDSDSAVSTIATRVDHRVGYHFSSLSHLRLNRPPQCSTLHIHYTFPSDFIVDPYELDLHKDTFTFELHPQPDLELPVFAASSSPSTLKLSVSPHAFDRGQHSFNLSLPIHARYGRLSTLLNPDEAYEILRFPQPNAFWQCAYSGALSSLSNLFGLTNIC